MITPECYKRDWFEKLRQLPGYSKIDYVVMEKFILALALTEKLKIEGLEFIFKGGTALCLLLGAAKRFSIDVDITTEAENEEVRQTIEAICSGNKFSRYEFDERRSFRNKIPKAHYKLFYISEIDQRENYILLDVLYEKNSYPAIMQKEIKNSFVSCDEAAIYIAIPTIESMAGDKLTAYAPNTIGIKFGQSRELEIIKQIYDLGNLFDRIENLEEVSNSYELIAPIEIKYRDLNISPNECLSDTINTSLLIARREKNRGEELIKFEEVKRGIIQFQSYTISDRFRIDEVVEASAKASLLAARILKKDFRPIEPFDERKGIESYIIDSQEYNYLNKLKNFPNRSLYYFNQTIKLL
jgi:hypothetical protein